MQRPRPSCSIHLSRRSRRSPPHRPMPVTRQPRRTDWTDMAGIGVRHVNRKGSYDLAVIGAGSAGFSTAITAAEQGAKVVLVGHGTIGGSEEHTSELQSLMRNSYVVFVLQKKQ